VKYLNNFKADTGIEILFRYLGKEERLPPTLEITIFRFVQEAVQNAHKHAHPKQVQVKIEITPTKITVIIIDDGKGFDLNEKKDGAFGLLGMRERVNILKGELIIESKLNKGTLIRILIPIYT